MFSLVHALPSPTSAEVKSCCSVAVPPPLGTFQATQTTKDDVLNLLTTINGALAEDALTADQLGRIFARSWPELEQRFAEIKTLEIETPKAQPRDTSELLEELTQLVRGIDVKVAGVSRYLELPREGKPSGYPFDRKPSGYAYSPKYPGADKYPGSETAPGSFGSRLSLGSQAAPVSYDEFVSQTKEAVVRAEQERSPLGNEVQDAKQSVTTRRRKKSR
jgi:hypothetical protein